MVAKKDSNKSTEHIVKTILKEIIPKVQENSRIIAWKVQFIESDQEGELTGLRNILYRKMEEVEKDLFGTIWIINGCPDIFSQEGEEWLESSFNQLSSSKLYQDHINELKEECRQFAVGAGLIGTVRGWVKYLEEDEQAEWGYRSHLSEEQIERLFPNVIDNYFDTSLESFRAMLGINPFPPSLKKPIWLLTSGRGKAHKVGLREFLKICCCRNFGKEEIVKLIHDKDGQPIQLTKGESLNIRGDFEKIFQELNISPPGDQP